MQKFVIGLTIFAQAANAIDIQAWTAAAAKSVDQGLHLKGINEAFNLVADDGCERAKFIQWISKWGKEYKGTGDFEARLSTWIQNNLTIRNFNQASVDSGVHNAVLLDHNGFSDKTQEELDAHLGHQQLSQEDAAEFAQQRGRWRRFFDSDSESEEEEAADDTTADDDTGGDDAGGDDAGGDDAGGDDAGGDDAGGDDAGGDDAADEDTGTGGVIDDGNREHVGILTAGDVDWSWATQPVQAQGVCGSCWAFTGITVLEGTQYAYQRPAAGTERVRKEISHQHPVSCSGQEYWNFGCNGGDAERMWQFFIEEGTIDANEYVYVSGPTGQSGTCEADNYTAEQGLVTQTGTVSGEAAMIEMIQERPLATAFNVNSSVFSFYSFGLIRQGDSNCYSGSGTNHQMAVVGYDSVGQSGTHEVEKADLYARPEGGWYGPCDPEAGEWIDEMYPGYCMYYVYSYEDTFFDEGAFWKIQNSWGEAWGDKGFAYYEADGTSNGVCNMYEYASQWVKTNEE